MFARLRGASARELLRALEKAGFEIIRQKGSHIILHNPKTDKTTLVAMHPGELPRWLLKRIIRDAGFTDDEFRHFL
jgi:predicted RNA binding protein YcfA (HicA-like mRNA interferase family)